MQEIINTIADNNERVRAIIADTQALVTTLKRRVQKKQDNEAAKALLKALGWEK